MLDHYPRFVPTTLRGRTSKLSLIYSSSSPRRRHSALPDVCLLDMSGSTPSNHHPLSEDQFRLFRLFDTPPLLITIANCSTTERRKNMAARSIIISVYLNLNFNIMLVSPSAAKVHGAKHPKVGSDKEKTENVSWANRHFRMRWTESITVRISADSDGHGFT